MNFRDTLISDDFGKDLANPYPRSTDIGGMLRLADRYIVKRFLSNKSKNGVFYGTRILQSGDLFKIFNQEILNHPDLVGDSHEKISSLFNQAVNHIVKHEFINFSVSLTLSESLIIRFDSRNYNIELEIFFDTEDGIESIASFKSWGFNPIKEYGLHSEILISMDNKIGYPCLAGMLSEDNFLCKTEIPKSTYAQTA